MASHSRVHPKLPIVELNQGQRLMDLFKGHPRSLRVDFSQKLKTKQGSVLSIIRRSWAFLTQLPSGEELTFPVDDFGCEKKVESAPLLLET